MKNTLKKIVIVGSLGLTTNVVANNIQRFVCECLDIKTPKKVVSLNDAEKQRSMFRFRLDTKNSIVDGVGNYFTYSYNSNRKDPGVYLNNRGDQFIIIKRGIEDDNTRYLKFGFIEYGRKSMVEGSCLELK